MFKNLLHNLFKLFIHVRHRLVKESLQSKKAREIFDRIIVPAKISVQIDYREPLFEESIGRDTEKPYAITQTYSNLDIFRAIARALREYFHNESESGVHWKSQIVGIKVSFDLS